jgi:hypothetical protein
MQTKPIPEIEESDLKAARDFLTSFRKEERQERLAQRPLDPQGPVTVRNGIARARHRSAVKTSA